jgi:hypothetical protein
MRGERRNAGGRVKEDGKEGRKEGLGRGKGMVRGQRKGKGKGAKGKRQKAKRVRV